MSTVVATFGVFDGFHRGHRELAHRAVDRAAAAGARSVAFTFDLPPRAVLADEPPGLLLASLGEKVDALRRAGVREVRVLRFDSRLATKDPERFLAEHVFARDRLAAVVVGYDFAFGRGRAGTVDFLVRMGRRLGFAVDPVEAVLEGGIPVSSSRIREALVAGRVEEAGRCLGRPFEVPGLVEPGDGRGRSLGFPTANLRLDPRRLRPGRGVYAVRVDGLGSPGLPAVANVGIRPTFGPGEERMEVHLLQSGGDLLGKELRVRFVARLRQERKFSDVNELQHAIQGDIARARALLEPEGAFDQGSS